MRTLTKILISALFCLVATGMLCAQNAMFFSSNAGSSSVTPPSVAGLLFWYEANAGVTCTIACANLGTVTAWADQSSNANNLTCVNLPVYNTSVLDGLPGISFVGASSQKCTFGSTVAWPGAETIFVVEQATGAASSLNSVVGGNISGSFYYRVGTGSVLNPQLLKNQVASIGTGTSAMVSGTYYQSNVTYNSTTGAFAFRQAEAANGSGTNIVSITAGQTAIATGSVTGTEFLTGTIVEIFAYNTVLSGPNITALESYLFTKYGI
jgi:hypothetical protein